MAGDGRDISNIVTGRTVSRLCIMTGDTSDPPHVAHTALPLHMLKHGRPVIDPYFSLLFQPLPTFDIFYYFCQDPFFL